MTFKVNDKGFFVLMLIILMIAPKISIASCKYIWQCDNVGKCKQVPICDNVHELKPIKPLKLPPLVGPSLAPLPKLVVPPIGTSQCYQARLCDDWGNCSYETVCR